MQLPSHLLDSINGLPGFDRDAFVQVHASGQQITSVRINPLKVTNVEPVTSNQEPITSNQEPITSNQEPVTNNLQPIPWTQYGYYLDKRPSFTFDPLFHAGCYYVQEASSMFLEQALLQTADMSRPLKVLDLSAAPGGKSTHLQSLLPEDSLLVSNEVIKSRANILADNIIKWGCNNVMVTNNDPAHFARLEGYFDIIVVDAPCSGSGLFRRDPEAIAEWSVNNVALCSQRQQRILADVLPALKKEGLLIYSTCSYSAEEDEDIMDWLGVHGAMQNLPLATDANWGITETVSANGHKGYRFWPDKVKGEGFFIACFQKRDGAEESNFKVKNKPEHITRQEMGLLDRWIDTEEMQCIKHQQTVYAWPQANAADFSLLLDKLRVVYSGCRLGELMRDKLVPDHALALSNLLSPSTNALSLTYEQAIAYLQRKDLSLEPPAKGWQVVTYRDHALGWINALPNRINNYYPKELRILKER